MENQISEGNLSEVRPESIEALNTFHTHVRYTITLMTSVLAGSVGMYRPLNIMYGNYAQLSKCHFGCGSHTDRIHLNRNFI